MDVTQGTPDGGTLAPVNGHWMLLHDAATGRFARRFSFLLATGSLATGGLADTFRWQANSAFTLVFPSLDYDAHAVSAPEGVTLTNSGSNDHDVQVSFPVPRTLLRVKIAGAQSNDVVEGRRTDGNVITEAAFASVSHGSAGALLNVDDVRLVLRQKRGGTEIPLRATGIAQVIVRSAAANVRVGVVLPSLSNEVFTLGADAAAVLSHPQTASNIGAAIAVLLQGACNRLTDALGGALLPATVPMTLVIESDTPTQAHISSFALRYRLGRQRFADNAPKRVFDFAGKSLSKQTLVVEVPRAAALWSATLRMMGPLQTQVVRAQEGDGGGDAGDEDTSPPTATTSDLGVTISAGESAATRLQLAQAALVQGVTMALVALAPGTIGRARLHTDNGGKPGEVLGEGAIALTHPGASDTVRVDFDHAGVVSAGAAWVSAQCGNGALLWLTLVPDATTSAGQVLKRAAGQVQWNAVSAAAGRGAVAALVTAEVAADSGATSADPSFHGVQLRLDNQRLQGARPAPGARGDKETHFDITSALTPLVQPLQHSPAGALQPVTLNLVSSEAGRVTVYPPEFEFDV